MADSFSKLNFELVIHAWRSIKLWISRVAEIYVSFSVDKRELFKAILEDIF